MKTTSVQEPVRKPSNDDRIICPNCTHEFRGIPLNFQQLMIDAGFEPPFMDPVKQDGKPSIEDVQSLVDASEMVMKWLVKNVHQWNFSEYDWLNAATKRVKASLPPTESTNHE